MKKFTLQVFTVLMLFCIGFVLFQKAQYAEPTAVLVTGVVLLFCADVAVSTMRNRMADRSVCRIYTGVTLGQIFIPEVYADIQANNSPERTAFVESGVVVRNPLLDSAAQSGAKKVEIPLFNDLDASEEPNISDDTDTIASPGKVDTGSFDARNAFINKGYGAADLAREIAGTTPGDGEPMTRIKNRFGTYWMRQFQRRTLAAARGVLASNITNNAGDMLYKVSLETTVGVTAANKIGPEAVIAAAFTLGDRFEDIKVMAMHSVPYQNLVNQQLIAFVRAADGTLLYTSYLGIRIVVDDSMPVIPGTTSGLKYVTMLFGTGAIGYGVGNPPNPVELERFASKGNGAGVENLWERKTWLIHPFGLNWTDASVAGVSATPTELRNGANWTRVLPRKSIPLAFLQTNG
jgi:Major capsid protein 13-like